MTTEFLIIGVPFLLFGKGILNAWCESRCTSNDVWFHDWLKNDTIPETVIKYEHSTHTKTLATFRCRFCYQQKEMVISDTKEDDRIFEASD